MPKGICYLVGAGPGDPLLMTIKGRECIAKANVILYDYLCNPVFLRWARRDAELIYAGKKCGAHVMTQDEINNLLINRTSAGNVVVRLKGGDPYLFGRGGEEGIALMNAGCRFENVPGVSSAISGPIYAGIPLTHKSVPPMITVFTGHESPEKLKSALDFGFIARSPGTKVMVMGIKRLPFITGELLAAGMDPRTPVALVRWATTTRQQTVTGTLATITDIAEKENFQAPAVAIFGETVRLRETYKWFESLPLFGRRVAVAGSAGSMEDLICSISRNGADVLCLTATPRHADDSAKTDQNPIGCCHSYDWIIFRSPAGVGNFFSEFWRIYSDIREIGPVRVGAFGPGTADAVRASRLAADIQSAKDTPSEIIRQLEKETSIANSRILLEGNDGDREILEKLSRKEAIVDLIPVGQIPEAEFRKEELGEVLDAKLDALVLADAMAAKAILDIDPNKLAGVRLACTCPEVAEFLKEAGRTHEWIGKTGGDIDIDRFRFV